MTQPIAVEIREGAGYVRYRDDKVVETIDVTETCSVAADVNAEHEVVGIEILDVAVPWQLDAAKTFAHEHGLLFPRNLAGAVATV
jgi:uncharacterized protein YuzE